MWQSEVAYQAEHTSSSVDVCTSASTKHAQQGFVAGSLHEALIVEVNRQQSRVKYVLANTQLCLTLIKLTYKQP